jgi:hypothetical protein
MEKRCFCPSSGIKLRFIPLELSFRPFGFENILTDRYSNLSFVSMPEPSFIYLGYQQNGTERHSTISLEVRHQVYGFYSALFMKQWPAFRNTSITELYDLVKTDVETGPKRNSTSSSINQNSKYLT